MYFGRATDLLFAIYSIVQEFCWVKGFNVFKNQYTKPFLYFTSLCMKFVQFRDLPTCDYLGLAGI
jgi:hypothetical protein